MDLIKNNLIVSPMISPFVDEVNEFYDNGFTWRDRNNREHVTMCAAVVSVCDAVARSMLQSFKQYIGFFGCCFYEALGW